MVDVVELVNVNIGCVILIVFYFGVWFFMYNIYYVKYYYESNRFNV